MLHSIFALELCAPFEAGSALHLGLQALSREHRTASSLQHKWTLVRRASDLLMTALPTFERGCWDFFDDDPRARSDFTMWCNGMLTEEGSRKEPSGIADPYRGEPRYLTFTIALLLVQGTPTERTLATRCNIPEEHLWRRDVFAHMIGALPYVNFASVKGDVMYLLPRDQDWGLTKSDLAHEKFHYLRTIV